MGKRETGRNPLSVKRREVKTDGAFGKETADQVVSGDERFNEDKAVQKRRR